MKNMNTALKKIIAELYGTQNEDENLREAIMAAPDEKVQELIFESYGQSVPPVAVMRKNNISICVNHSRWVKGKGIKKTKEFFADNYYGSDFEPRGGRTEVRIEFPDGEIYQGKSVCSKKENWDRRVGLYLAIEKALNSQPIK